MSRMEKQYWESQANTWNELLEAFLTMLKVEARAPKTIRWYRQMLVPFVAYLNEHECNRQSLQRYVLSLMQKMRVTSVDAHIRAIKAFLGFLHQEEYLKENLARYLKRPRLPKQYPYILNDEQVHNLLRACDASTWTGQRNYTMLLTFLDTGIRLAELIGLTLRDVDLNRGALLVHGKGGKDREVYMGRKLRKEMAKWLKVRGFYPYEEHVFITKTGEPLNPRGVERIVERLAKKAKIQGVRCSPHTLRHTFATNFIRNGGDAFTLQKILGHTDIQTCMVYVHMSGKHVQEAMMRHSPVDKLTQQ